MTRHLPTPSVDREVAVNTATRERLERQLVKALAVAERERRYAMSVPPGTAWANGLLDAYAYAQRKVRDLRRRLSAAPRARRKHFP